VQLFVSLYEITNKEQHITNITPMITTNLSLVSGLILSNNGIYILYLDNKLYIDILMKTNNSQINNALNDMNNGQWTKAIKTLTDSDSDIFVPLNEMKNNIYHFACIRGNKELIQKMIESNSSEIYNSNKIGDTCCHLLAKNNWDDILLYVVSKKHKYLKLSNNNNELLIHLVYDRPIILNKLLDMMINHNYMKYLNNIIANNNKTILIYAIENNYDDIIDKLVGANMNINLPSTMPPLIYAIISKKYNYVAKFVIVKDININVYTKTYAYLSPIIIATIQKNLDMIKLLVEHNADINYGGFRNEEIPLFLSLSNHSWEICRYFLSCLSLDFNNIDLYSSTALHYALEQDAPYDIIKILLSKCDILKKNNEHLTPFHIIIKKNIWDTYKNDISLKITDEIYNKIYTVAIQHIDIMPKFINVVDDLINTYLNKTTVTLNQLSIPTTNFGMFNSNMDHVILYNAYILKTYNNITMPIRIYCDEQYKKFELMKLKMQNNVKMSENNKFFVKVLESYINNAFQLIPSIIFWKNKMMKYVCDDFLMFLKRSIHSQKNQRFVMIKITLFASDFVLHANVLLYDKKTNILRRFEPYGNMIVTEDSPNLDIYIAKIFNICLTDEQNKTFKYLKPQDYMSHTNIQSLSMEHNETIKKLGDPAGYCLAWCIWFIELKMKNPDVDDNLFIEQSVNKIIEKETLYSFIRNYAFHLTTEKNKILSQLGVSDDNLFSNAFDNTTVAKIVNYTGDIVKSSLIGS